ncbi:MAG: ABC transporter permease [Oscillospiraceae bacterium]|nr:ABC transporter permease [Oscillospiraceae bacterium]
MSSDIGAVNNENGKSAPDSGAAVASSNFWLEALRRLFKNKTAVFALVVFAIVCISCALHPYLTKYEYMVIDPANTKQGPSLEHLLGTDHLGRDLFTRILYGGTLTLRISFVSTVLAAAAGCILGLVSGYFGKRTDFILSHLLDMVASVPVFLLVILAEAALGWGKGNFMYAMGIAAMPQFARLIRASVMSIVGSEYIEAARALGVGHGEILARHVLHNVAPSLIIRFTSAFSEALLLCTIMGYLGIAVNPPTPEWGALAYFGRSFIRSYPHMIIIPCSVITISVISLGLFGDGLRDALDPRE